MSLLLFLGGAIGLGLLCAHDHAEIQRRGTIERDSKLVGDHKSHSASMKRWEERRWFLETNSHVPGYEEELERMARLDRLGEEMKERAKKW